MKVFGAWTNLVDMKAGNTLDTIVPAEGRRVVRHYLQDVGSTFGAGATGPREFDEGWESLFDAPRVVLRLLSFGLYLRPWQHVDYPEVPPSIGRFEGVASTLAPGRRGWFRRPSGTPAPTTSSGPPAG